MLLQFLRSQIRKLQSKVLECYSNFVLENNKPKKSTGPIPANSNVGSTSAIVQDFFWMNPLQFLRLQVGEDWQNFIDVVKKIFRVMQLNGNDRVELVSYHNKDVAHIWFTQWKKTGLQMWFPSLESVLERLRLLWTCSFQESWG